MEPIKLTEEQREQIAIEVAVEKLDKGLVRAIKEGRLKMGMQEIRMLVDRFYALQKERIHAQNQIRAIDQNADSDGPSEVIDWLCVQTIVLEKQIVRSLDAWSETYPPAKWAKTIKGIGPILSSGLAAHIDIAKCNSVSSLWRFAGYDPTSMWIGKDGASKVVKELAITKKNYREDEKIALLASATNRKIKSVADQADEKSFTEYKAWLARRPWNATLKVICWKIGESFVYRQKSSWYGQKYRIKKLEEIAKNEQGKFKDFAASMLEVKNWKKDTEAYKAYSQGKLPPAHIHARAKRYAVKLFLSHYFHRLYQHAYRKDPPEPYAVSHLGHKDIVYYHETY